jgi:hypothetical protein
MKIWSHAVLAMLLSVGAAHADVLNTAFDALNARLKIDGGGLVLYQAACRHPLDQ